MHVKSRKRRIKEELPKKGGGPLPPPPPLRSPPAPPPRHLRRVPRTTAMPPSRSSEAPWSMSPSCPNYFPFLLPADPSMEYPSPLLLLLLSTYPFLPMQQPLRPQKRVQKRVEFSSRLAPSLSATTLLLYKLFLLSCIYRRTTTTTAVTESICKHNSAQLSSCPAQQ